MIEAAIVSAAASMYAAASEARRIRRREHRQNSCDYCGTADNHPGQNCRNCGAPAKVPTAAKNEYKRTRINEIMGIQES